MEEIKKEYGGCLSILLPLWIIGQILSMIYNFILFGFYSDNPTIPILLIGINIIALIGIILLLQFKKNGFYIFVLAYIFSIILGLAFPDAIERNETIKIIIGMCLFFVLMSIKNKETKKNGYQTLGLFRTHIIKEDSASQDNVITDNESLKSNNASEKNNEVESANEYSNQDFFSVDNKKEDKQNSAENFNCTSLIYESPHKTKKHFYIIFLLLLLLSIVGALILITKDKRSNQEIYNEAKTLIDCKEYREGVEELNKIKNTYIPAKALLGKLYYFNDTVGINKVLGEKLLWEAFEQNDTNACHTLVDIYYDKGDWDVQFKILSKLDELGVIRGSRGLAWLFFTNEIGGKNNDMIDFKKAEFYALKKANIDSYSSFFLGQIYSEGGHGVEKDDNKAFYWWKNGAKLGDANCYDNLGWCYFNGNGVNQNYKKAYESFKNAIKIDSTDAYAHFYMALLFKNGFYVKTNRDSLKYYLQKAKNNGNEDALIMYENEF